MPNYVPLQTETEEPGVSHRGTSTSHGIVPASRRLVGRARAHASNTWSAWKSQPNSSELVAIALVYLVQGVTDLAALAQKYLLKDELHASPAQVAFLISAGNLPWAIKPVIGLVSDTLPLWGYRRKSYLIASGLAGAAGWLALAAPAAWGGAGSMGGVLGLILVVSAASAVSDVVVDSMVVERARREAQADSGSLQSLCWAAYAVGQIGSAWFSGSLVERLGPRPVFALTALLPLLVVLVGAGVRESRGPGVLELLRRLSDDRREEGSSSGVLAPPATAGSMQRFDAGKELQLGEVRGSCAEGRSSLSLPVSESGSDSDRGLATSGDEAGAAAAGPCGGGRGGGDRRRKGRSRSGRRRVREQQQPLLQPDSVAANAGLGAAAGTGVAASGSASSFVDGRGGGDDGCSSGGGSSSSSSTGGRGLLLACATLCDSLRVTSLALWGTMRRREVAGPVLFLFLSSATPAADDAMFFFMTAPSPTGLGFSATFLGDVALAVAVASLVGVGVYHAFLRRLPLRRVLLWGSLLAAACQASSLVLATRANVALGLPDHLFALGDSVLVSVIQNVLFMPTMVLSARLCPPGLEATLFAGLMSVGNIATGLRYFGGALLTQLLGVTATDFRNLPLLLGLCSVALVLPLPLLVLVPASLDQDREEQQGQGQAAGGGVAGFGGGGGGGVKMPESSGSEASLAGGAGGREEAQLGIGGDAELGLGLRGGAGVLQERRHAVH
ncbi:hypothetical protein HXX76_015420 [Chlamydomonas incerta]|uniref:Uncharacterized protein n=1 Tax=Chlamydomonas incerta TaxID=51695 RepID=A0A835SD12_CHLIN|nr:hypothetical protein HXX76_015420 [Chlamydomonas incerta]|eukprot:KAG2423271.1 hypothetical protein HXX76_015420 [Chlamydomonas incerta]